MNLPCPLCHEALAPAFFEHYHHCPKCDLRFLNPSLRLSTEEEFERYNLHQNQASDLRYQNFVEPVAQMIRQKFNSSHLVQGLDFGCGADSALTLLLRQDGFQMELYDPKYFPEPTALARTYDFVAATEVIEHMYHPDQEFARLRKLLKARGALFIMTHIYSNQIDFGTWYYRRDPCHVCFYSSVTLRWVQQQFGFARLQITGERTACLEV